MSRIAVLENKNENHMKEDMFEIKKEIKDLDIKMAALEVKTGSQSKWKVTSDFAFKVIISFLGAFLAWKLSTH